MTFVFGAARRSTILLIALALSNAPGMAAQVSDSSLVRSSHLLFTRRDAVMAGAFLAGAAVVLPLDRQINQGFQGRSLQSNGLLRDVATGFRNFGDPGTAILAPSLFLVGRIGGSRRLADLGLHATEAILISAVAGEAIKGLTGRARPYVDVQRPYNFKVGRGFSGGNDYASLPSGHTYASFALAATVTAEVARWSPRSARWVGPIAYGVATGVGLSRMYNNKHWASDIVLAAMVGTFSGRKIVQWSHDHSPNWLDRALLGLEIGPNGTGGLMAGLRLALK